MQKQIHIIYLKFRKIQGQLEEIIIKEMHIIQVDYIKEKEGILTKEYNLKIIYQDLKQKKI